MNRDEQEAAGIRSIDVPCRASVERFASGGESLVYNPLRDEASALNKTATEVWELCDGGLTVNGIAQVLGDRYGVDENLLLEDVTRVLEALRTRGLVDVRDGRTGSLP